MERTTAVNEPDFRLDIWDVMARDGGADGCVAEVYDEADARLIAAAPILLAALHGCVNGYRHARETMDGLPELNAIKNAEAVIELVEGEP
jgi:hypothetical protein